MQSGRPRRGLSQLKTNKAKLIVWDNDHKKWINATTKQEPMPDSKDSALEVLQVHENVQMPLHKMDTISSDDAYNFYASYYKRMPQSQEGEREKGSANQLPPNDHEPLSENIKSIENMPVVEERQSQNRDSEFQGKLQSIFIFKF